MISFTERWLCIVFVFFPAAGLTQRAHEIQIQAGITHNRGVSFYDYVEAEAQRRHNFEFDQTFQSRYYSISWQYPFNNYLDAGIYYSHSITAALRLLEAESLLFDSKNPGSKEVSPLFTGSTMLLSHTAGAGTTARIYLMRYDQVKIYTLLTAGIQYTSAYDSDRNVIPAEHPGLRQHLQNTYLIREKLFTAGYGLGVSYRLKNGISFRILEVCGRNYPGKSLLFGAKNCIDIRTGVSYQFYRAN